MASGFIPRLEQIRAARSMLGWSQQVLAAKAGVAVSTVADFERGQRNPVPNNALAICQALQTAGVVFTETGVSHGFHWTFMTERGTSDLIVTFTPESAEPVIDFASIFGTIDPPEGLYRQDSVRHARTEGQSLRFCPSARRQDAASSPP